MSDKIVPMGSREKFRIKDEHLSGDVTIRELSKEQTDKLIQKDGNKLNRLVIDGTEDKSEVMKMAQEIIETYGSVNIIIRSKD